MIRSCESFFASVLLICVLWPAPARSQTGVWQKVLHGYGESVGINPVNPNTIYAQDSAGYLAVSRNQGNTWTSLPAFVPAQIRQIIVHPKDTLTLFITDFFNGLWRSSNGGTSWTIVIPSFGIDGESVTYDPIHPDTMYAGNFGDGSLYRSMDRGTSWTLMGAIGTNLCALAVRPDSANILLAGSGSGRISKSTNAGTTWHLVKTAGSTEIPKIVINRTNPQIAYATAFEGALNTVGVWKSTDGGESWFKTGLQNINVWALDIDQANPNTLYAGTFDEANAGIYKTTDGGTSWTFNSNGILMNNAVWTIHIDPITTSHVYASLTVGSFGMNGIYRFLDSAAGVQGYVRDSLTNAVITNGIVTIQPANQSINLATTGGRYYYYKSAGDTSTSQTFSVTINSYLIKQQAIPLISDSLQLIDLLIPPGSIRGTVYNDLNRNGARDPGEPGVENWTILLAGQLFASVLTDAGGEYAFTDLLPGSYTVAEQPRNGWVQTGPVPSTYALTISQALKDHIGKNFGNRQQHAVISVTPVPYSMSVTPSATIAATFDTTMNPVSFSDTVSWIVCGKQSGLHRGSFSFDGSQTVATFTADKPFQQGELVTVDFTNRLLSSDGFGIAPHITQFTIGAHPGPGSFVGRANVQVGSAPWGVSVGDIDGDGDNDIVAANSNSNSVSVVKNDGYGSFGGRTDYTTGLSPISVVLTDVDLDGDLDILSANNGNSNITVLRNDGTGSFGTRTDYAVTFAPFFLDAADMDGDGYPDVVTGGPSSSSLSVMLNNRSGGFPGHQNFPISNSPWSASLGDLDNDGAMDVAAVGGATPSSIQAFSNLGNGTLGTPSAFSIGSNARSGCIADLTGDGLPDLLATNSGSSSVSILPKNGSTFGPRADVTTGSFPWGIGCGDLNGDGLADIIVANGTSKTISLLTNSGGGSYVRADYPAGASPRFVAIADLDGDGDEDAVVTNSGTDSISVYINAASATVNFVAGWNLMSLPVDPRDHLKTSVFPTATTNAFVYAGTYMPAETLHFGTGFWMKFAAPGSMLLRGDAISRDTVVGRAGWNMIGALSSAVSTGAMTTIPPSILASNFYFYNGTYHVADSLVPGTGYWIKLNQQGNIVLASSGNRPLSTAIAGVRGGDVNNALLIRDGSGREQELMFKSDADPNMLKTSEMPPIAPGRSFDARFESGRMVEGAGIDEERSFPVVVTNSEYPLIISWQVRDDRRSWRLRVGADVHILHGQGSLAVASPAGIVLEAAPGATSSLPRAYAVDQNFPNPFNPVTTIRYQLPEEARVVLKVYNVLGQEVAVLVDGMETAGYKSVAFDASGLPSGIYSYRISAGIFNGTKKMLLIR